MNFDKEVNKVVKKVNFINTTTEKEVKIIKKYLGIKSNDLQTALFALCKKLAYIEENINLIAGGLIDLSELNQIDPKTFDELIKFFVKEKERIKKSKSI